MADLGQQSFEVFINSFQIELVAGPNIHRVMVKQPTNQRKKER